MASQVYCQVSGPGGALYLGKSCTELTVGELTDSISGLSIGDVWEGQVINGFTGTYNAGTGLLWLTDNQTKERYLLGCVNVTTAGGVMQYLSRPIKVTRGMVLEAMTQAVV